MVFHQSEKKANFEFENDENFSSTDETLEKIPGIHIVKVQESAQPRMKVKHRSQRDN